MKIQQQGSPGNYVVFDCLVGDAICMNMNDQGRGIDEYACGVQLQYGCPNFFDQSHWIRKASIIIVIDVSFDSKDAKLKALKQLRSWVTNKCRSFQFQFVFSSIAQRSHSSAKRQPPPPPVVVAAAAATASAATQSSFLLQHLMCCVKKSTWYIEQKRALAAQHTVLWVL